MEVELFHLPFTGFRSSAYVLCFYVNLSVPECSLQKIQAPTLPVCVPIRDVEIIPLSTAGDQAKGPMWYNLLADVFEMHVPGKSWEELRLLSGVSSDRFRTNVWLTIPPRAKIILYWIKVALKTQKNGMTPAIKYLRMGPILRLEVRWYLMRQAVPKTEPSYLNHFVNHVLCHQFYILHLKQRFMFIKSNRIEWKEKK